MTQTSQQPSGQPSSGQPWSVPVALHEVPETGRSFVLVADEHTRAAIAKLAGLRALPRLEARFEVTPRGRDGLHVMGTIAATIGQDCVVTLEPIESEIEEPVDLVFGPPAAPLLVEEEGSQIEVTPVEAPEPLVGGSIDLGAIASEFLMLAIDPYPRKPGAVFEPPAKEADTGGPFAALAALKKKGIAD
jgi:Large ribosomal RNA subunit accumulation protein YceD